MELPLTVWRSRRFRFVRDARFILFSHHRRPILVSRCRAGSAARPCTISCRSETSETIPFPGADSIFSSGCGAISRRLRVTVSVSRRDPGDRNASVQKIDGQLDELRRDGAEGTNIERRRSSGKKIVSRLRSWFALSFAASDLPSSEGTHSRGRAGNPQTSDPHGF
jgi:hypothetical protein